MFITTAIAIWRNLEERLGQTSATELSLPQSHHRDTASSIALAIVQKQGHITLHWPRRNGF